MIYQTMTRNKLLRLTGAKGWLLSKRLYIALYQKPTPYYEVAFIRTHWILDGNGYDPFEEEA